MVDSAAGAVTDGWVSFEKEVTFSSMPDGANPVYLAVTTGLADWNGREGAIEVGTDDVSVIPEVLENHIRGDLNDDKEVNATINSCNPTQISIAGKIYILCQIKYNNNEIS